MHRIRQTCLAVACLVLAACTTIHLSSQPAIEPQKTGLEMDLQQLSWWQLSFKLSWPSDETLDLSSNLMLAEQVLLPVLLEHEEQLHLWRFHRRAARDATGHQFSLIFFAGQETAEQIGRQVIENELTIWLQQASKVKETRLYSRSPAELGLVEETSDRGWPVEIQRSWPWFIMGASQSWLMQVQQISQQIGLAESMRYAELLEHYRQVETRMNAQWRENGQHAYLHHLNALYGYEPVRVQTSELKRF